MVTCEVVELEPVLAAAVHGEVGYDELPQFFHDAFTKALEAVGPANPTRTPGARASSGRSDRATPADRLIGRGSTLLPVPSGAKAPLACRQGTRTERTSTTG